MHIISYHLLPLIDHPSVSEWSKTCITSEGSAISSLLTQCCPLNPTSFLSDMTWHFFHQLSLRCLMMYSYWHCWLLQVINSSLLNQCWPPIKELHWDVCFTIHWLHKGWQQLKNVFRYFWNCFLMQYTEGKVLYICIGAQSIKHANVLSEKNHFSALGGPKVAMFGGDDLDPLYFDVSNFSVTPDPPYMSKNAKMCYF